MIPTPEQIAQAEQLEAEAARQYAAKDASFDRCDTDGFLSQWASGIAGDRDRLAAELLRNGGVAEFPGLFTAEGVRLPAVLLHGLPNQFAPWKPRSAWRVEDPQTGRAVRWINHTHTHAAVKKAGLEIRQEMAPAKAVIRGTGRGLSGQAWAVVVRTDGGYPGRNPNLKRDE